LSERPCEHCAKPLVYFPRLGQHNWRRRRFCNRACSDAARRRTATAACPTCGSTFAPRKSGQRFCSLRCSARSRPAKRYRKSGDQLEHRAVVAEVIGRPLRDFETVHHKNGRKGDNDPGNLELWCIPQPSGQRVEDLLDWMVENYPAELATRLARRSAGAARLVRMMALACLTSNPIRAEDPQKDMVHDVEC